jgi:Mce-associated membrane protein
MTMTETLETPIYPTTEEAASHEPAEKPRTAKRSRSKAAARPAKSGRNRETASGAAKLKVAVNGSVFAAEEAEENSAKVREAETARTKASRSRATSSSGAKRRAEVIGSVYDMEEVGEPSAVGMTVAVETLETQEDDEEELQPNLTAEEVLKEKKPRRIPSRAAVWTWIRRNLLVTGLAVALVVAVVFLTTSRLSLSNENSLNSARTSALAAAQSDAVDLANYSYKNLNQDFGKVLAESTPSFKQDFLQTTAALKTTLTRYDASASAKVLAVGLVSVTANRAVALVFLNQTVDNTLQKNKPVTTTESRVEITLVYSGGHWLIDQVSLV